MHKRFDQIFYLIARVKSESLMMTGKAELPLANSNLVLCQQLSGNNKIQSVAAPELDSET